MRWSMAHSADFACVEKIQECSTQHTEFPIIDTPIKCNAILIFLFISPFCSSVNPWMFAVLKLLRQLSPTELNLPFIHTPTVDSTGKRYLNYQSGFPWFGLVILLCFWVYLWSGKFTTSSLIEEAYIIAMKYELGRFQHGRRGVSEGWRVV